MTSQPTKNEAPETHLDVRPLLAEGTEPFAAIMAAVAALPTAGVLVLRTPFDPQPLHKVMADKGFTRETSSCAADDYTTRYWRTDV